MNVRALCICFVLLFSVVTSAATKGDSAAVAVAERMARTIVEESAGVESLSAVLYVRERVEVEKKNLLLNIFPDMTRFDKGKECYLAELFYNIRYIHNALPEIRRLGSLSTFERSNGEMDRVLAFMTPQIFSERLFNAEQLSPLYPTNLSYYHFSTEEDFNEAGAVKICFSSRFDNIQLLKSGWVVVDNETSLPERFYAEGWDEQSRFAVEYVMGCDSLERFVVKEINLSIDYSFAANRLGIEVFAVFDYSALQAKSCFENLRRQYDITHPASELVKPAIEDFEEFAIAHRPRPLTKGDSLVYISGGVIARNDTLFSAGSDDRLMHLLWTLGDEAVSSHSLSWGNSDLKLSPIINPSYLSYSSSRGLAYKFSLNVKSRLSSESTLELKPEIGYNFKRKELYWGVKGRLSFAPLRRASLSIDIGRESSIYSSYMLDAISSTVLDSLDFESMPFFYYRDFHIKSNIGFEVANGFELKPGVAFYKRTILDSEPGFAASGQPLKEVYRQFAPNIRLSWQPGMYYYIAGGKKVNIGSLAPRFALDVEQGVSGLFGSNGVYTRAEFDAQYRCRLSSSASLYMRFGAGGYFYTKDIYFVNYSFLKNNLLPLDKGDDVRGEFQLLSSEWYNSANKYIRAAVAYESPFLAVQKLLPSARFVKNEALYCNVLFISHLLPYTELGHGVETPYVNLGFFVSFENMKFGRLGYKISFSLFDN
ncbi:MAG: hypothetical protein E7088_09100 [Bacteroidales bacterium]|nr:hypothetical protein [Bacteroidales bacterium]